MAQAWKRLGAREVTVRRRGGAPRAAPRAVRERASCGPRSRPRASRWCSTRRRRAPSARAADDAPGHAHRSTTGARSPATSCSSPPVVGPTPPTSGSTRSGSSPGEAVEVDDQLRATGVDGGWLYAIGDVNGRALLTHMGKYQAAHRGRRDPARARRSRRGPTTGRCPRSCSPIRSWRSVGLTEAQAREQGIDVKVVSYGTGDVAGATVHGKGIDGTCQLVVDDARRVIVGATFTGPGVGEMLHAATIAIAGEVPLDVLWHAVPVVPDRQRGLAPPPRGLRPLTRIRSVRRLGAAAYAGRSEAELPGNGRGSDAADHRVPGVARARRALRRGARRAPPRPLRRRPARAASA